MNFQELIEKRHSVRSYKSEAVEKEKLDAILQAARLAPTAANRQAFKVLVISTKGRQEELKKIYQKDWFVAPPYILCVCYDKSADGWVRRGDNVDFCYVDAAIVMDHIILAATSLGLGTCWIGAFNPAAAKEVLELGDTLEPMLFTPLGYEQEISAQYVRKRKSLEDLVIYR